MRMLRYVVRPAAVFKYFSLLCFALALTMIIPLAVALASGQWNIGLRYLSVLLAVLAIGGASFRLPATRKMQTNEAMVVTALIFLFGPLVLSWPMMGSGLKFVDAFFEAVSAATTTGLSTLGSVEEKPVVFLFGRAWMQWIGGLGIVVLSLAALIRPGSVANRLGDLEDDEDDLIGNTRMYARNLFGAYAALTGAGIVLLILLGTDWFDAIVYSFAAVSTGGYSPHNLSLAGLESQWGRWIVIILSLAGGVSLILYRRWLHDGWKNALADSQLHGYMAFCVVVWLALSGTLWLHGEFRWPQALGHGALNALSAQSTAGFSSIDLSGIDAGSKLILIISMFFGGCTGSTAGGVKIFRLMVLLRVILLSIQRTAAPKNAVSEVQLDGRRLGAEEIQGSLVLVSLFAMFIGLSWLPFVLYGFDPLDALFEVTSAIGTVGLSAGITDMALSPVLKLVLCADMLLGRLEIVAWLVVLSPGTWWGKRMED